MDGETFDALARGAGIQAVRRAALAGLVGGPLGLDWRATGTQDRGAAMGLARSGVARRRCSGCHTPTGATAPTITPAGGPEVRRPAGYLCL